MNILSLKLQNFSSYYGKHSFDFDTETGNTGYAVFGPEGSGKTSIMWAILWCLYGKIEASQLFEGEMKTRVRPVVDASQMGGPYKKKWYAPLLTDKAFENGDHKLSVELTFEQNGSKYVLLRRAEATKNKPIDDGDLKIKAHLSIDSATVPTAKISGVIEEVIPRRISRFFFIEMDAIEQYANLLFGAEPSATIREDVESILGLPALDRSEEDFRNLAESAQQEVTKHRKKSTKDAKLQRDLNTVEATIRECKADIKLFKLDIKSLTERIDEITILLGKEGKGQVLQEQRDSHQALIDEFESELKDLYAKRANLMSGSLWMSLIQRNIETVMDNLKDRSGKKEDLVKKKITTEGKIEFKMSLLKQGETKCEQCGHTSGGLGHKEREKEAEKVAELKDSLTPLIADIEAMGDPTGSIISLSNFKNSTNHTSLSSMDHLIGEKIVKISTENRRMKKVDEALANHDVHRIAALSRERTAKTEQRGDLKAAKTDAGYALETYLATQKRLEGKLPTKHDTPKVKVAEKKEEVFLWLSNIFKRSLDRYLVEARESVQNRSTETFLAIIPEPEKYKEITISEDWDIEVIGVDKKPKTITNPGHKQVIAVSLFDGLRNTSKHSFPTFFDNPGSNISDETLARMTRYFWDIQIGQVIMLSHGGGLKIEETIDAYGDKLARAWVLSYVDGEETLSQIQQLI